MFKVISDILKYKNGRSLDRNDFDEIFNLYLIQRWISMHSDLNVEILNATVNTLYKTLDDDQHFKLMTHILPENDMKGQYIKVKPKKPSVKGKKDNEVNISEVFEESSQKIDDSLKLVLGEKRK